MITKTSNPKTVSSSRASTKNGKSANGALPSTGEATKSINEQWIEKYGVDDSKEAKSLLRAWSKSYENRNKRID